jgi:hypothetical protein
MTWRRLHIATFAALVLPSPCHALSGAELLREPRVFGEGYVWGVTETIVTHSTQGVPWTVTLAEHRRQCLYDAGIGSKSMYDAVFVLPSRPCAGGNNRP